MREEKQFTNDPTPPHQRMVTMIGIICSIAVIILALLQLTGVWEDAAFAFVPLMGVNLLIQGYTQWQKNRGLAWFSLASAAFVLICTVVIIVLK